MPIIGGIDLGNLTDDLFVFTGGTVDAGWAGDTPGYAGDIALDGLRAGERTSGTVAYAGTVYTNDGTLGAWQAVVDQTRNAVNRAVSPSF